MILFFRPLVSSNGNVPGPVLLVQADVGVPDRNPQQEGESDRSHREKFHLPKQNWQGLPDHQLG